MIVLAKITDFNAVYNIYSLIFLFIKEYYRIARAFLQTRSHVIEVLVFISLHIMFVINIYVWCNVI